MTKEMPNRSEKQFHEQHHEKQRHEKNNLTNQSVHALIVAAGKGSRFGIDIPKQYVKIKDKTILEHSVNAVTSSEAITHLFLVIAPDDQIAQSLDFSIPVTFVYGGAERWESVNAGVQAIIDSGANLQDLVLIHDAARPCVLTQHVDKVISTASNEPFGAILGVPVVDTIKHVVKRKVEELNNSVQPIQTQIQSHEYSDALSQTASNELIIQKTVDRSDLWKAQTPQVFRLGKLKEVLDKVARLNLMITDEASAFELSGYDIRMVEGSPHNIKLTYQEDLTLIEMIVNRVG